MTTRMSLLCAALAAACAAASPAAGAHVVLEYQAATAGTSYKATFKVGHGSEGKATRQISVQTPAGVRGARPMAQPGWALQIERNAAGEATRITWTAKSEADVLPDEQYGEFVLQARMPDQPGPLYWPVNQVCVGARADWVEVPRAGQPFAELKSPAAYLEILPGSGEGMDMGGMSMSGHNH